MELSPQFKRNVQRGLSATTGVALAAGLGASVGIQNMTHEAPTGGFVGNPTQVRQAYDDMAAHPINQPSWSKNLSRQFEGYHDVEKMPKGTFSDSVVAIELDGEPREMGFQEAWDRSKDKEWANDVWVVGAKY